ncbi:MAG: hypothetical protein Q9184_008120, partial [Pyrenodesmia sp. 2 TL-2023]
MRLNGTTVQEVEILKRLTAAGCSSTPSLLAVKVDVQDESVLNSKEKPQFRKYWGDRQWWMPGGYIVYILMAKLEAESLDINSFWDEKIFAKRDRDEVRVAFRKTFDWQGGQKTRGDKLRQQTRKSDVEQGNPEMETSSDMAANTARPITSEGLTKRSLPTLKRSQIHTMSASASPQVFMGIMAEWTNFEMEVRMNFLTQPWGPHAITFEGTADMFNREQVMCANETGVVGRFHQQVGHVMTCVGLDTGMRLYFGDWHGESHAIPDLTIWNQAQQPLVTGEAKTPWTVNLTSTMAREYTDPVRHRRDFTRSAGQVAYYMKEYSCKYGFLTTYDDTIFFKQEPLAFTREMAIDNRLPSNTTTHDILWYSRVIHHNTSFIPCGTLRDPESPDAYADKVSLRECMFFLMKQVQIPGNYRHVNNVKQWTQEP